MKTSLKLFLYLAIVFVFAGCSGHTHNHGIVVSITGAPTTVTPGQVVNLTATVTNDSSNSGVTWTVLPADSTFTDTTSTLTFTAPPSVPADPTVTITATSVKDPSQSATVTFTIAQTVSNVSFLQGPYAFEVSGFDGDGNALTMAGTITADGNGSITSGEIDENDHFIVTSTTGITGTYTLDANLRGIITLNQSLNAFSDSPTFSFTLDSTTNTGNIIGADPETPAVSGPLVSQSAAVFSATPSGAFILRGSSDALTDGGSRFGEVGRFTIGSGGGITGGLIDSADIANGNDSQDATLIGSFTAADGAGRGTAVLDAGSEASNYVYYAVSPTKIFLIETNSESNTQVLAVARSQSTLTANSVNGTGAFGLIGGDFDAEDVAQFGSVAIGQAVISGGNTVSINCDINDSGNTGQCTSSGTGIAPISGTVTFDPSTGRGTLTLPSGFDDGFVDSMVFYLEGNGAGVLLDTTGFNDASSTDSFPEALVGDLIPQTSTGDITGQVQGVGLTSETDIPAIVGVWTIDELGDINGLFDGTIADEGSLTDSANTGALSATDSTGRSTATINGDIFGGNNVPVAAFEANPNEFFVIGEQADSSSNLGIFTPQTLPAVTPTNKPKAKPSARGKKFAPGVHKAALHAHHRNLHHPSSVRAR